VPGIPEAIDGFILLPPPTLRRSTACFRPAVMLLEYPAVAVAALCASSLQIRFSATGTPHFMLKPSTEKIQTSKSFMCPIPAAMYHDPLRRHDLNSLTIAGGRLKLPRILPEQAEVKNT
jgi:hypothetical protein